MHSLLLRARALAESELGESDERASAPAPENNRLYREPEEDGLRDNAHEPQSSTRPRLVLSGLNIHDVLKTHSVYIVSADDRTDRDVGRHVWGNPDAGVWLAWYNGKLGINLKTGDRLLVPKEPPSAAEILHAKREVYPKEYELQWARWLASCEEEECERVRRLKADLDHEFPVKIDKDPEIPMTSEGEFEAAYRRQARVNREVRTMLDPLNEDAARPEGPVLRRLSGGRDPLYGLSPGAREFLRGAFQELGVQFPDDDVPIHLVTLSGYTADTSRKGIRLDKRKWEVLQHRVDYAHQLAVLGHEYMHVVQRHRDPAGLGRRYRIETMLLEKDRYRMLGRQWKKVEMDPGAAGASPLDPNDPDAALDQVAEIVYYRILRKFGADTIDAMPLGLKSVRPWGLRDYSRD
jgi:hypothetical protein